MVSSLTPGRALRFGIRLGEFAHGGGAPVKCDGENAKNKRKTNGSDGRVRRRELELSDEKYEQHGAGEGGEGVELAGFKNKRFFARDEIAEQAAAGGVDYADEDGRRNGEAGEQGFLGAKGGVGAEAEGVDDGDSAAEVFDASTKNRAHDRRSDDDLDVACIGEERRRGGGGDKHAVANEPAADAGDEREEEYPDDIVAALEASQRAGKSEGEGRAEIKNDRKLKRGGWHRTHYGAAVTARKAPRCCSQAVKFGFKVDGFTVAGCAALPTGFGLGEDQSCGLAHECDLRQCGLIA